MNEIVHDHEDAAGFLKKCDILGCDHEGEPLEVVDVKSAHLSGA